jgi:uncharacterized membrane protein YecN with MAPEG domain
MALLMVPLSLQISLRRAAVRATFGDGDDVTLRRRIRAHGNLIEYAPLALILLGLVEWNGAPVPAVWTLGVALLASRILHACGMLYFTSPAPRAAAMIVQHTAFVLAGAWLTLKFAS